MKFWDSSALVPLTIPEPGSPRVEDLLACDPDIAVWWGAPVECVGALIRVKRSGRLADSSLRRAKALLDFFMSHAFEIHPADGVRDHARRLLAAHPLRASDALQLAAAIVWREEEGRGESFVCLDDRLRAAATLEGFRVLPYSEEVNEARVEYAAL